MRMIADAIEHGLAQANYHADLAKAACAQCMGHGRAQGGCVVMALVWSWSCAA